MEQSEDPNAKEDEVSLYATDLRNSNELRHYMLTSDTHAVLQIGDSAVIDIDHTKRLFQYTETINQVWRCLAHVIYSWKNADSQK